MSEKRIRTSIETEFEVRGRRATGKIKNVSEGGLFVGTAAIPEEGENVALRFRSPMGGEVSVSGLVWWTTEGVARRVHGFGLRVLDDSPEFRVLVANL